MLAGENIGKFGDKFSNTFKCNRTLIYTALKFLPAKFLHYAAYHARKILAHWHLNNDDTSVHLCSVQTIHVVHKTYRYIKYATCPCTQKLFSSKKL